jgi:DNA-binding IclR family transcriptional regulator
MRKPVKRTTKAANSDKKYANTLLRGLAVLRCFSQVTTELSTTEIARQTGLPQPTVWRLVQALLSEGYLVADATNLRFKPGLAVLRLGFSAISGLGVAQLVRPELIQLASDFHSVVGIAVAEDLNMRYIERHQAPDAVLSYNIKLGWTLPMANSASGWAYLAAVPPDHRKELIQRIEREQPELWKKVKSSFSVALKKYPTLGAMVNVDTFHSGLTTVGMPVFKSPIGSMSLLYCTGLGSLLPMDIIEGSLLPRMRTIVDHLSQILVMEGRP